MSVKFRPFCLHVSWTRCSAIVWCAIIGPGKSGRRLTCRISRYIFPQTEDTSNWPQSSNRLCWILLTHQGWPGQDGHHFTDNIIKCIFCNENCCILIKNSLKYVRNVPIDNNPVVVQIISRRQAIIWSNDDLVWWRMYVSLGINELTIR